MNIPSPGDVLAAVFARSPKAEPAGLTIGPCDRAGTNGLTTGLCDRTGPVSDLEAETP